MCVCINTFRWHVQRIFLSSLLYSRMASARWIRLNFLFLYSGVLVVWYLSIYHVLSVCPSIQIHGENTKETKTLTCLQKPSNIITWVKHDRILMSAQNKYHCSQSRQGHQSPVPLHGPFITIFFVPFQGFLQFYQRKVSDSTKKQSSFKQRDKFDSVH